MRRLNARAPSIDSSTKTMDSLKLPIRPASSRSNLFSRSPKNAARSNILIIVSISIALAVLFVLLLVTRGHRSSVKRRFGIVIDGGSTGTRIHVFDYVVDGGVPVFDFGKRGLGTMRVNPGLSSYAEDPKGAGGSLLKLLEFGRGRIPEEFWGETEVRLMATAGLRMLELGVQERILNSCRGVLRSSGFKFYDNWASVITGSDEGVYAWVVANYALGTLGGDPQQTTGIIELGGASAQVTFVSNELLPPEHSHTLRFGNVTYNLYSHSLLHFGQNAALESLQESLISGEQKLSTMSLQNGMSVDPCAPKGFSHSMGSWNLSPDSVAQRNFLSAPHAEGNFSECRSAALMLLQKGKGPASVPKLRGNFLATENFFYTSKFFGLTPRAYLSDLMMAGQQFCEEDWSTLKKKYHSFDDEDLMRYCFSSAYIVALLHDSFGIALDERIRFSNQVGDIPLDWALGAFILRSRADLDVEHLDWIAAIVGDDSPTLLSLVVISIILMFTAWSISKWRKPQLKTIYDLEKGRYIVTRVNRC